MPHLKKKSLVPVAFASLTAVTLLAPYPAFGQSPGLLGGSLTINSVGRDLAGSRINGLRGGYEAGDEIARRDDEDTGGTRRRNGQNSGMPQSEAGVFGPEAGITANTDVGQRERRNEEDDDPFAPLGIRVGSFLLFPELNTESVYSDNIFLSSTNPQSDWALEITPRLTVRSDWSRHSLIGTLRAVRSYYERFESENEETFSAALTGQIDVRRNTNLVMQASYSENLGDRSDTDFPAQSSGRSKERNHDLSLEGNHTFNRVTLTLRGELSDEDFDDGIRNDGTIINNDDRDFTERRLTGRAGYEFQPDVTAFVEASTNERKFAERIDDGGTINGSSGYDVQGGLAFQLTGKLTGEVSGGYAFQTPDDATLKDVDGLIFNAGLEWEASGLTTLRFDASSTVAETTQTGSAGSIVRSAELSVEHRPRRNIVLGATVGYEKEEFSGSGGEDDEWRYGMRGEYIFTRSLAVTLEYEHLKSTSSSPGSDYNENEIRFGVRVRR